MTTKKALSTVRTKDGYIVTWSKNTLTVQYTHSTDSYPFKISMDPSDPHFNVIKSLASDLLNAQNIIESR